MRRRRWLQFEADQCNKRSLKSKKGKAWGFFKKWSTSKNEMDEHEDTQLSEPGLNDFRPMPRILFVGGAEQDQLSETDDDERTPTGSTELARTTELEERTRVLEMAMGKILARLISDDLLIPFLNRDAQPAAVVATRNSPALSNVVVPTKPRGSGRLNPEPSSSRHNEELLKKNADLERQLKDVQKSIDELRSPRSHQQTLDLDSASLNLSITVEPYQEGFKILHLETYDGSGDLDEHLHTYQAIMRIQNANDAMMCKVHQKEGEFLRDYMQRFKKATLDIDNVPDTICLSALLHGLKPGQFLDDQLENPPKLWNEGKEPKQPEGRDDKKKQKVGEQREKLPSYPKYDSYIPLSSSRSQILAQIQHWVKRPHPETHDSSRADKSKYCDYHRGYGHNREDCQSLKDELEFLACNGKLEGYVQKPYAGQYSSEPNKAYRGRPFNRRGQAQKGSVQNQKDYRGVGYSGIPPPSGTINMIFGGMHSGGQSARGRKAYACQVMTVNKSRPLKRPFEEAEWENAPITFSPANYKRADGELDVMMPHADPFVSTVHIGNHNINKVFIDTGSSPYILYWSCFQKMQLNPSSLQKYEGPIYGFNNQPVPVEGVITLPIYVGSEPRFRMASVPFLVVKMESAFNAILGRATLCELKAIISQSHLCMKFPTPQGVGVLKGNQKMVRACYQDTFKKVGLAVAPTGLAGGTGGMETVPLNPNVPERTVKIGTKLTEEERVELLEFLRVNQDVFAWTTDEMPGIPAELTVHKLSTDPTKRRVEYSEWVSNPVLVKKPNGKWRMCIDFTNLNEACPKDPHPLPNVEKLVERAAGHEQMSFLDASSGYHQVQLLLDDQEKIAFYAGYAIYCYVMMPFGLKNAGATYQKLVQIIFKLQICKNIKVYVDDMIVTKLGKFLGYVVSKKGIEVNPEKVQAVQQMEPPKTVKDVQRLTGCVAALHRFIARSAEKCFPFFKALREPKNFQWTDECQQAFDELKQYLASAPLLSKPVEGESLYLYLGVTEEAVSSVLLREENKNQKPICYIVVYTDLPLRNILQKPELSGRLIRWSVELSEYNLKFQSHTTIKGQAMADFLVECISATVEEKAPEHPIWVLYVDRAANIEGSGAWAVLVGPDGFKSEYALSDSQLVVGQVNSSCEIRDPQLGRYASVVNRLKSRFASFQIDKIPKADNQRTDELSKLASSQDINPQSELPEDPSVAKLIKRRATHFTLLDSQLYKRAASMPLLRCLTPYEVEYAMREVHEGNYVKKCPTCQFNADDIHMAGEMLASLSSPWPFAQWGVDLLGPFVKGKGGCTYLVVAVDYFTKWIEAKPLSTTTEKKIEEFLFNSIVCRFGIPKRIIADNGPQFRATALRSFCNDYGIELALTSVYTSQSNGQAESANKIVLRGLKMRVLAVHSNWIDKLNKVLWSCCTTSSSATGETPFSLAYGAEAVIPVEVGLPSDRANRHNDHHNKQLLRENLDLVEEVGDLVLRKVGLTNAYSHMGKLAPNWEGPYMVICIKRPGCYQLTDLQGRPLPFI
ncbi:hypothetical protein SLEP1_g53537 [Rubroshorea leprosula]|uniref:Integrase catalytic domain-containing protein n=1 Tax=Rubroshorea leprosula TaxID=152421 RepID=A0AAV5MA63_9ROSI|nr:hypothetical protein SLEP1_g53537 [Rubroshorea leprosula]